MLYQPRVKDYLIRKLYFAAKREGKKMTQLMNEMLEEYLRDEPEPPPYEPQWMRRGAHPDWRKRQERAIQKLMRDYHGGDHGEDIHRQAHHGDSNGRGDYPPEREHSAEAEAPAYPLSLGYEG